MRWRQAGGRRVQRGHEENTILILGGTTEGRASWTQELEARTESRQPCRWRAAPAAVWLKEYVGARFRGGRRTRAVISATTRSTALIDATHPYAPTISDSCMRAASQTKTQIIVAGDRPHWRAVAGDRWTEESRVPEPCERWASIRNVFLAVGPEGDRALSSAPQHTLLDSKRRSGGNAARGPARPFNIIGPRSF